MVWNHHPLSSYAIADRVYIDGTLYYDRSAEDKRLTELNKEKADLVAAERSGARAPSTTSARTARRGDDARRRSPTCRARLAAPAATRPHDRRRSWADHERRPIHPITGPTSSAARSSIAAIDRGGRRERAVPAGAKTSMARGEDVYPGSSTRARRWA